MPTPERQSIQWLSESLSREDPSFARRNIVFAETTIAVLNVARNIVIPSRTSDTGINSVKVMLALTEDRSPKTIEAFATLHIEQEEFQSALLNASALMPNREINSRTILLAADEATKRSVKEKTTRAKITTIDLLIGFFRDDNELAEKILESFGMDWWEGLSGLRALSRKK